MYPDIMPLKNDIVSGYNFCRFDFRGGVENVKCLVPKISIERAAEAAEEAIAIFKNTR